MAQASKVGLSARSAPAPKVRFAAPSGFVLGHSHAREVLVSSGDTAFQGSVVTYTRADGHVAAMPVASNLRRTAAGTLDRLWIYIDLAPLFAEQ